MDEFYYTDLLQDSIPEGLTPYMLMLVTPLKRFQSDIVPLRVQKQAAKDRNGNNVQACALYANERLRSLGFPVYGHAWTRSGNGTKVYSGYDAIQDQRPTKFSRNALNAYNKKAAEQFKQGFNPYDILDNDIVSLYYNNSDALLEAYYSGNYGETNTHTGNIRIINGIPYVEHNIHGDVYVEPLLDLLGSQGQCGVVSIWRPKARNVNFNFNNHLKDFNGEKDIDVEEK